MKKNLSFKLTLKATEAACRIQEVEGDETISDHPAQSQEKNLAITFD